MAVRTIARVDLVNAVLLVGAVALYLEVASLFRGASTCPRGEACMGPAIEFIILGIPAFVAGTICLAGIAVRRGFLRGWHLLPVSILALIAGIILLLVSAYVEHPHPI